MSRKDDILDHLEDMGKEQLAMFAYRNLSVSQQDDILEEIEAEDEDDD